MNKPEGDGISCVLAFRWWLQRSGRGYLAEGLVGLELGQALLEIFRRAGVRGITGSDSVADTLPMAQELIALRFKPRAGGVSEQA